MLHGSHALLRSPLSAQSETHLKECQENISVGSPQLRQELTRPPPRTLTAPKFHSEATYYFELNYNALFLFSKNNPNESKNEKEHDQLLCSVQNSRIFREYWF